MECIEKDEETPKTQTLNEKCWFDNKIALYKRFCKEVTRSGSNFADSWGTEGILFKRRVMSQ